MAFETRATTAGELRFITDGGKPRIDGRAILFDSWSVDLGGFKERMVPGSVTLDGDLLALFDHATDKVLGRTSAGTMEVRQDQIGVAFTAYPPETTWAKDLQISMSRGDIKGCSYRMMVEEDKWYLDMEGNVCRDVLKASVSELTVTSMPAYPETTAEARSHAAKLAKTAKTEDRAGREISGDNLQVLKSVFDHLELASDTLEQVIAKADPSFNEDNYGLPESSEMDDNKTNAIGSLEADSVEGSDIIAPAGSADGEGEGNSDGASESPQTRSQTFVPGFGFIKSRKDK